MRRRFPRIASLRSPQGLRDRLAELHCALPCDDEIESAPGSPLAKRLALPQDGREHSVRNRFVIQPMEGWDGSEAGAPSELTERRWRRFGASGAGWIWGGEAVAVRPDGRANPNQLVMNRETAAQIGRLRRALVAEAAFEPLVGLQLTHSGRWSRPQGSRARPRTALRHPLLDARVGVEDDRALMSDAELRALVPSFARAAALAQDQGFDFVDLKHCHGYLLHEILSARRRRGDFGGASARSAIAAALPETGWFPAAIRSIPSIASGTSALFSRRSSGAPRDERPRERLGPPAS